MPHFGEGTGVMPRCDAPPFLCAAPMFVSLASLGVRGGGSAVDITCGAWCLRSADADWDPSAVSVRDACTSP